MRQKNAKQVRRMLRRSVRCIRMRAVGELCEFINGQPLRRRLKLALMIITGNICPVKIMTIQGNKGGGGHDHEFQY